MNKKDTIIAISLALLAAISYAINTPISKELLKNVAPTFLASFLYLGAGIGIGIIYSFHIKNESKAERLTKDDLIYTIGMILLDIIAPILLMMGIKYGSSANASLLGNFEIVMTTIIANSLFKEKVSSKLWLAIIFITLSSIILSFDNSDSLKFSLGSIFVLLAASCWGLENNCTRKIADKSSYQIVTLKGLFSGIGSFMVAVVSREQLPLAKYILYALMLGFISFGLSIFMYVKAQRILGAAKTSAYYAINPFIGTFLCFLINGEKLTLGYFLGLIFMIVGSLFVVYDSLLKEHSHIHTHIIVHTHDNSTHTHIVEHEHSHQHFFFEKKHMHHHDDYMNSEQHKLAHNNEVNY